jgi:hypothetical protein
MSDIRANGASRPGDDPAPPATGYLLELPISFGDGAGVTRTVSREEVRFTTGAALAGGQRLAGVLRFPAEGEAAGLVLRFVARVACIRPSDMAGDAFEVMARFEGFDLAPEGTA